MKRRGMALLVGLWMTGGSASAQLLELLPSATANGPQILLRDIVRGVEFLPEGWGEREVAEAPAPRKELTLTLSEIATVLGSHEDMRNVVLRGQTRLQISSPSQSLEADHIDRVLEAFLDGQPEENERRFRVCRDRLSLPPMPKGDLEVAVLGLREQGDPGAMVAELDVRVGGDPVSGTRGVSVPLVELRPYWAAARPLLRGAMLSGDDVVVRWGEAGSRERHYPASDPVAGMELRRAVPEGRILTADMLAPPVYARRGEIVRVVTEQGGLTVTLNARALADGRRNERIGCLNERSGQRLYVRLVRPREAVLDLPEESAL